MSTSSHARTQRQRGVAAVELAILLPLLVVLIAFPLFFGRVFMYYSVAQKAAQNAAMYLATIPKLDMQDTNKSAAAKNIAEEIVEITIGELKPGTGAIGFQIQCDDSSCGLGAIPNNVSVNVRLVLYDDYFSSFTWLFLHDGPLVINADAKIGYLGQ